MIALSEDAYKRVAKLVHAFESGQLGERPTLPPTNRLHYGKAFAFGETTEDIQAAVDGVPGSGEVSVKRLVLSDDGELFALESTGEIVTAYNLSEDQTYGSSLRVGLVREQSSGQWMITCVI